MKEQLCGRPVMPVAERLIVALDVPMGGPRREEGRRLADELGDLVTWYKIGLGMLATGGMELSQELKERDRKVFLDLKLFDIPQTIENSVRGIVPLRPDYLTVHGDPNVVRAAVAGRGGSETKILAISVLTNVDRRDLDDMLIKPGDVEEIVLERAALALASGADGVIASAREASAIRSLPEAYGKLIVTPGVRPAGTQAYDQKRVSTPRAALDAGADQIVVGRPIIEAQDRVAAARSLLAELEVAT